MLAHLSGRTRLLWKIQLVTKCAVCSCDKLPIRNQPILGPQPDSDGIRAGEIKQVANQLVCLYTPRRFLKEIFEEEKLTTIDSKGKC